MCRWLRNLPEPDIFVGCWVADLRGPRRMTAINGLLLFYIPLEGLQRAGEERNG